jgi:hypothetical protein
MSRWINGTGQGLTWSSNVGASFVGIVQGNAIKLGANIANGTNLDIFCDVDYIAGGTVTTVAPAQIGVYLIPLLSDASTYGDGQFTATQAGPPSGTYLRGVISYPVIGATQTVKGMIEGIRIPPGTFDFLFYNNTGATIPASSTVKYRTYNIG